MLTPSPRLLNWLRRRVAPEDFNLGHAKISHFNFTALSNASDDVQAC